MKTSKENHQSDDEFEPLELGTVSEETKGDIYPGVESLDPNSRIN